MAVPLIATATSGLPVAFRSATPAVCTVSGATATTRAAGTCTVTAFQSGSDDYVAAPDMTRAFQVKATQTISFAQPEGVTAGARATMSATATSGLPVSFRSATPAVCTVSGSAVTTRAAGTCTITAFQAGNDDFEAAPGVARSFRVRAGTRKQAITFSPPPGTVAGSPVILVASATSRLPVSLHSDTRQVCTVSGRTLTALAAGMCTITASQGGNALFRAAPDVARSLEIQAGRQSQTITFGPLLSARAGAQVPLAAAATSGLPVAFRSGTPLVCTLSGTTVTAVTPGACTITAVQGGSALYPAAPDVTQSFRVTAGKMAQTITFAQPDPLVLARRSAWPPPPPPGWRSRSARTRPRARCPGRPSSP